VRSVVTGTCLVLCLALTACSGGGSATGTSDPGRSAAKQQVVLYVMPTNLGRVVTLPWGSPVYVNIDERPGSPSVCTGSCARTWAPVITGRAPGAADGADRAQIGTVDYDGARQVTYAGHRLYYYNLHRVPLVASGQGADGRWYAILPTGQVLRTPS
jgi:predicted lipoprotein with Yx(FWY)xxD motif